MLRPPLPPSRELATLIGLLLLLLFASPLAGWWARAPLPWYTAYLLWALVIVLAAALAWRRDGDEP
jgi:hypothetical protein